MLTLSTDSVQTAVATAATAVTATAAPDTTARKTVAPTAQPPRRIAINKDALTHGDTLFFALSPNADGTAAASIADELSMRHNMSATPDSTFQSGIVLEQTSLVQGKPLRISHRGHTTLGESSQWIFAGAVITAIIIGLVRLRANSYIANVLSFLYSEFNWKSTLAALPIQNYWPSQTLKTAFYLGASILGYELAVASGLAYNLPIEGFMLYLAILASIIAYFLFKYTIHSLIGYAFNIPAISTHIKQCNIIYTNILSILIMPLILVFPFISESNYGLLIKFTVLLLIATYLWRVIKSIRIILLDYISIFYCILYLCAVEALPFICMYKLASLAA